jgi:hypothetical protein
VISVPDEESTFESIVKNFAGALGNLADEMGDPRTDPQQTLYFLRKLGWNVPEDTDFSGKSMDFITIVSSIRTELEKDDTDYIGLAVKIKDAISSARNIGSSLNLGALGTFTNDFPNQLLDYAIIRYLEYEQPKVCTFLLLTGVFDESYVQPASPFRIGYIKHEINWDHLGKLMSDPHAIPDVYGWGGKDFDFKVFMDSVQYFFNSFDMPIVSQYPDSKTAEALKLVDNCLLVPIVQRRDLRCGIEIYPLRPDDADGTNWGLAIAPFFNGETSKEIPINDFASVILKSDAKVDKTCGIELRSQTGVNFFDITGASTTKGNFEAGLVIKSDNKILIIGSPDSSRLDVKSITLKGGAKVESGTDYEVYVELEIKDASIVIKAGEDGSDSFINSLMSGKDLSIDFSLLVGYSYKRGVYFGGSGGLEVSIPVHQKIGPIEVSVVVISLKVTADGKVPLELGTTIKGELGPLKATVENMGVRATFSFPKDSSGNLGPLDMSLGFKPPKGVGLALDAGPLKGGGYLFLDPDKGEYAGALELGFSSWCFKAIGIISTRMPDGSSGFSLLIIITADFGAGIQLGYGFVLLAVGGLLGLNRILCLQPLMEGVRTGAVNGIMFPTDVVANAPRIISDLRTIFPPKAGIFLIGPMAKLGWGQALVSVALGIIVEIPGNIAIVGVLKVAVPPIKDTILVLQVNFAGAIEFDKQRMYFFASMYESRLLFITIEGEMGLLVAWGDDPNFLISVGGFHPQFSPPPLPFPTPSRVALNILNTDYARILMTGYFAITTNTVQFGAGAELYFGFSCCNVRGNFAFDALIQFSPTYFIIQVSTEVSLRVFGMGLFSINLQLAVDGPSPWHANGYGSISFWFFDIDVPVHVTWGEEHDTILPDIAVLPILLGELKKAENWTACLPANSSICVTLRKIENPAEDLVLHPLGTLHVSQRAVPLDLTIAKIGNQKVQDGVRFSVTVPSGEFSKAGDIQEMFAMAQYQEMEDSKRLSRPAYQKLTGGIVISVKDDSYATSRMAKRVVRYDTITIDTNYRRFADMFFLLPAMLFSHFLGGNAAARSDLSLAAEKLARPFGDRISVTGGLYAIAFSSTNQAFGPGTASFTSEAQARDYLQAKVKEKPDLAEQLHVIPVTEVCGTS